MYAVLAVNIEVPLEETFHYHIPSDLEGLLQLGHLVEVEFGRRMAQGIVVAFDHSSPVDETKPVIAVVSDSPVVESWQITLARWLSDTYLTPLNACLRLMLPPGLSRYSDIAVDINPAWDGSGRLTDLQQELINLIREKGDLRGRQIGQAFPKKDWKNAISQLARRQVLRKASVLDPPRAKPKMVRKAELMASPAEFRNAANNLGSKSKAADVLDFLDRSEDPLPSEELTLVQTGAKRDHLLSLAQAGLVSWTPSRAVHIPSEISGDIAGAVIEEPATVSLSLPRTDVLENILLLRRASVYYRLFSFLAAKRHPVAVTELYAATNASAKHLRRLETMNLVRLVEEEVWRDPLADRDFTPSIAPILTADQARVWGRVKIVMLEKGTKQIHGTGTDSAGRGNSERSGADLGASRSVPFLLHGVTGSGKTEIYMRAIEFALSRQQKAIVLVPEIALTPQTVRRFAARFPGKVAVLHSQLSDGERFDTWRRARQGQIDIMIGARSALFSPLPDLGVIVIDEEHDPSYKQTPPVPPPYYHARDVAIALGNINDATVIMGSATPDVVAYHRARAGQYRLLELPKRVMGHRKRIESQEQRLKVESYYGRHRGDPDDALTIPLPPIEIVDMRQELRTGNRSIFSRSLENGIDETLQKGEQVILFLNRRGTATFVFCRDCGHVLKCMRCDVPLTYHKPGMALICHHCGRAEQPHEECPQCGSKRIRFFGLGTESVEDKVRKRWPEARVIRWDRDTTRGKHSHDQLLAGFVNHEADILVGTQMIAKGLDLPLVTLVGVISADVSLGLPDYRTGERAFQILAQVAGRAGRGLLGGSVVMQTYQPGHYAVQAAAQHDFVGFYVEEIRFRTKHMLPPFRRLVRLLIVDPNNDRGRREAQELANSLRLHVRQKRSAVTEILGPFPPYFNRIDGRYRWQLIIRTPDPADLLSDIAIPPKWVVDIDPVSTL